MIEIFKAITELVKSDLKTSGGVTALSEECRLRSITGCFSSHGGVAGTDNRLTVFRLKPIFSSSGAMQMPNVGLGPRSWAQAVANSHARPWSAV